MSSLMDMDPTKLDELVKDYVATFKRIQKRKLQDRLGGLHRQRDLEVHFQPVVKSQEKMAKAITKSLIPLRETVLNLKNEDEEENEELHHKRLRLNEDYGSDSYGPLARQFKFKILTRDPDVDTSFGLYFSGEDGHTTKMGNKIVKIVGDNLIVNNDVYTGTKGLWTLITGVTKNQIGNINENFSEADLYQYIKLLKQTSALHQDYDPENTHPRSSRSWKWKHLLKDIWDKLNKEKDVINSADNDGHDEENENQTKDDAENVVRDIETFLEQREQGGRGLKQNLELIRGGLYMYIKMVFVVV